MRPFRIPGVTLGLLVCLFVGGCATPTTSPDSAGAAAGDMIYQVATLNSLLGGAFEGTETVGAMLKHGTLGLGTVDRLDGEMIVIDGTAYAVRDDGTVDTLSEDTGIPFGAVIPFDADTTLTLDSVDSLAHFQSRLDERLSSTNDLYAFRVTGTFDHLQTRSVTAQRRPYPTLDSVIAHQTRFTVADTPGTLVGFHVPAVFDGVSPVGYHAHFLTAGRDGGGHVLDVRFSNLEVQIDHASSLRVSPRGS